MGLALATIENWGQGFGQIGGSMIVILTLTLLVSVSLFIERQESKEKQKTNYPPKVMLQK